MIITKNSLIILYSFNAIELLRLKYIFKATICSWIDKLIKTALNLTIKKSLSIYEIKKKSELLIFIRFT